MLLMDTWSWVWDRDLKPGHPGVHISENPMFSSTRQNANSLKVFLKETNLWESLDSRQRLYLRLSYLPYIHLCQSEVKWRILIYCHYSPPFVSHIKCSNPAMGTQCTGKECKQRPLSCMCPVKWTSPSSQSSQWITYRAHGGIWAWLI